VQHGALLRVLRASRVGRAGPARLQGGMDEFVLDLRVMLE
jgi:hypothetical protein